MKSVIACVFRVLLESNTNPPPRPIPQLGSAYGIPVFGLVALHQLLLCPLSLVEPAKPTSTAPVTPGTLPEKPPFPMASILPFQFPSTQLLFVTLVLAHPTPRPPSSEFNGKPTSMVIKG